ncbi:hypothetical protein CspeluHIS016_0603650 [Cutaneotrichosporon spelunceum]|uniref:FHA domain-containing protein n=1 Tax=Cutaneotrichosporon spelunceum TaxID=1672016 RepID=A0AAD3TY58_9TREE|nr:hypothetical protein CspeluHIS016_0603650 [Cutaneotrichosporon spelunceum]
MRESSPDVDAPQVFGTLHFLKRKTGEAVSHIPLDSTRLTLGRERECDIRLYFEDVSKLHAEILFDEDSGLANLVVHGNNGLIYTPDGGFGKHYHPPSVLTLSDGDTLQIRKKLFRFSYGDVSASSYRSPAKTPGRRLSHRLSIVPQGKRFAPSPAKSRFATPGRAAHVGAVEEEDDEEDEPLVFDELVGLADGDEGDRIYLEKRDDKVAPKNPFMTPQPKGRAPLRNTSAVPRTRAITFSLPDQSALQPHTSIGGDGTSDNNDVSEEEEDVEELEEGVRDEGIDGDDVPAPATPTPSSIPLPDIAPMGGPRRQLVTPRGAYATPRGAGSDALRRALLIRSARLRTEAETIEPEVVMNHFEGRRRRSSGRTLPVPQPDSESSEDEDGNKENVPFQWVYEDGQGGLDDSDSDRESLDTEYSIPGALILDFHTSSDPGSPSESEGSEEASESGEEYSDERSHGDYSTDEHSAEERVHAEYGCEAGNISSDIDDEVDRSLICSLEEVERSPSPVALFTPSKHTVYAGARLSLAGIGPPMRFEDQQSPTSEYLPTGVRIPPTPSRLGKPVRLCPPARAQKAEDRSEDDEQPTEAAAAPVTPPSAVAPATPAPKTPAKTPKTGLTPAQRAQLATPLALPTAPASFRDTVPRPIETPRRSTFLEALRSAKKNSVSFAPETPAKSGFGTMRKRMPTPRVDRIAEVDVPTTPTSVEDVAPILYPQSPTELQPQSGLQTEPTTSLQPQSNTSPAHIPQSLIPQTHASTEILNTKPERRQSRRASLAGIRDLLKPRSKSTTLGFEDLVDPKKFGMRDMFRPGTPARERSSVPATPHMDLAHVFTAPAPPTPQMDLGHVFTKPVPPTPHMELADAFPEPEQEEAESEEKSDEEPNEEPKEKPRPRTRSRVPTRSARTTRASQAAEAKAEVKPKTRVAKDPEPEPEPEPEAAPARSSRRRAEVPAPKASPPGRVPTRRITRSRAAEQEEPEEEETKSAPTRRVTRSQTDELEEPETKSAPTRRAAETRSLPIRRSRRVLGEAEPAKEAVPKAPPKAVPKRTARKPDEKKAATAKTGVADKENSSTPDPEPKRKAALPVRVTRSRKA